MYLNVIGIENNEPEFCVHCDYFQTHRSYELFTNSSFSIEAKFFFHRFYNSYFRTPIIFDRTKSKYDRQH